MQHYKKCQSEHIRFICLQRLGRSWAADWKHYADAAFPLCSTEPLFWIKALQTVNICCLDAMMESPLQYVLGGSRGKAGYPQNPSEITLNTTFFIARLVFWTFDKEQWCLCNNLFLLRHFGITWTGLDSIWDQSCDMCQSMWQKIWDFVDINKRMAVYYLKHDKTQELNKTLPSTNRQIFLRWRMGMSISQW